MNKCDKCDNHDIEQTSKLSSVLCFWGDHGEMKTASCLTNEM